MTEESGTEGFPRPTLHHLNLKTRRLDEMIAWHGAEWGVRAMRYFPCGAWRTQADANHR